MGRKAIYAEKNKLGPGRKSKKQSEPVFDSFLPKEDKDLSSHQKKRAAKRAVKAEANAKKEAKLNEIEKAIQIKHKENEPKPEKEQKALFMSDDEDEEPDFFEKESDDSDEDSAPKLWLQPEDSDEADGEGDEAIDSDQKDDESSNEQIGSRTEISDDVSMDSEDDQMSGSEGLREDDMADSDDFPEDDMSDSDEEINPAVARLAQKLHKAKTSGLQISTTRPEEDEKDADPIPSMDEIQRETEEKPDMVKVQGRIFSVLKILSNFRNRHEPGRSRTDYMNILLHDICQFYSYNTFLVKKFLEILPTNEVEEFFEANERPRPITLRVNPLKIKREKILPALIAKGINVNPIEWSSVGLSVVNSSVPVGATPEYLNGCYMLQGASSFLPVMTLKPEPNETVLDMCAAPGGKTTHLATYMKNSGCIFSNDAKKNRMTSLEGNCMRMGVHNVIAVNMDGKEYGRLMPARFDRVLCDAPCSGTGVIAKDPRVKFSKTEEDILRCSKLQKELILSAIDTCNAKSKSGGYIVYSTCSLLVEENEAVVNYALQRRNVVCVETGLPEGLGERGFKNFMGQHFHNDVVKTKRIYPHKHNMDGFFVALLKKISNEVSDKYKIKAPTEKKSVIKRKEAKLQKKLEEKKSQQTKFQNKVQNKKINKKFQAALQGKQKSISNKKINPHNKNHPKKPINTSRNAVSNTKNIAKKSSKSGQFSSNKKTDKTQKPVNVKVSENGKKTPDNLKKFTPKKGVPANISSKKDKLKSESQDIFNKPFGSLKTSKWRKPDHLLKSKSRNKKKNASSTEDETVVASGQSKNKQNGFIKKKFENARRNKKNQKLKP